MLKRLLSYTCALGVLWGSSAIANDQDEMQERFVSHYCSLKKECVSVSHSICQIEDTEGPILITLEDGSRWQVGGLIPGFPPGENPEMAEQRAREEVMRWHECDWVVFSPACKCHHGGAALMVENQCVEGCVKLPVTLVQESFPEHPHSIRIDLFDQLPAGSIMMGFNNGENWMIPQHLSPIVADWHPGDSILKDIFIEVNFASGVLLVNETLVVVNTRKLMEGRPHEAVITLR